jgi:hypothetical protein
MTTEARSKQRELPEDYMVRYHHIREHDDAPPYEGVWVPSPKGGETIAKIFDPEGNEVMQGRATCSPLDPFNRSLGRKIALGRALKNLELLGRKIALGSRRV